MRSILRSTFLRWSSKTGILVKCGMCLLTRTFHWLSQVEDGRVLRFFAVISAAPAATAVRSMCPFRASLLCCFSVPFEEMDNLESACTWDWRKRRTYVIKFKRGITFPYLAYSHRLMQHQTLNLTEIVTSSCWSANNSFPTSRFWYLWSQGRGLWHAVELTLMGIRRTNYFGTIFSLVHWVNIIKHITEQPYLTSWVQRFYGGDPPFTMTCSSTIILFRVITF